MRTMRLKSEQEEREDREGIEPPDRSSRTSRSSCSKRPGGGAWRLWLSVALLPASVLAADSGSELQPGVPEEVFVAPGRATTILFQSDEKVAAISVASPVVAYKYDRSLNQLEITPAVRTAGVETNLNLRIGPNVYILVVRIVNDVRAQFFRRFALEGDAGRDAEAGLAQVRPLKPEEVDIVGAAKAMERAGSDPVFARAHPALRLEALGQAYAWNGCEVTLATVGQFLDQDLLVFRVQWTNRTNDALYLGAMQYGLSVGGRNIPIIARYAPEDGAVVYPGQLEIVYLAVQGYRLSRNNDWQLALPPDAAAVIRLLRG